MDPVTITAIQTVGFPIVATIAIATFSGTIVRWVIKKYDELVKEERAKNAKIYEDHRQDIKDLSNTFKDSLKQLSSELGGNIEANTKATEVSVKVSESLVEKVHEVLTMQNNAAKGRKK